MSGKYRLSSGSTGQSAPDFDIKTLLFKERPLEGSLITKDIALIIAGRMMRKAIRFADELGGDGKAAIGTLDTTGVEWMPDALKILMDAADVVTIERIVASRGFIVNAYPFLAVLDIDRDGGIGAITDEIDDKELEMLFVHAALFVETKSRCDKLGFALTKPNLDVARIFDDGWSKDLVFF